MYFLLKKIPSILYRRLGAVHCTSTTLSASVFTSSLPDAHFREFTFSPDPLVDDVCPSAAESPRESLPVRLPDWALYVTQWMALRCLCVCRHLSVCPSWPSPRLSWKWLGLHLTHDCDTVPYDDDSLDLSSVSGQPFLFGPPMFLSPWALSHVVIQIKSFHNQLYPFNSKEKVASEN